MAVFDAGADVVEGDIEAARGLPVGRHLVLYQPLDCLLDWWLGPILPHEHFAKRAPSVQDPP